MTARLTLAILAVSLLATTDTYAQQIDPSWPDWLKDGMENESKPRKGKTIELADGAISVHLMGKPSDPQSIEDGWYFTTDIKSESPMECYLFTIAMDLARLTNIIAENNVSAIGDNYGEIGNRSVYYTEAGNIGDMPYMALEWIYTAGEPGQAVVGYTKVRAAARGEIALACAQNELGHRKTFEKVFNKFVESATYEPDAVVPYYEEIILLSIGDAPQGVISVSYSLDEDGDTRIEMNEATLTQVDDSTLAVSDSTSISYSTPTGEVISDYEVSVVNGELEMEFSLRRNEDSDWVVSGEMQQKPVEFVLSGDLTPIADTGQMAAARALFASDDPEASADMNIWVASIDPSQFINARMQRDDAEVSGQATIEIGPMNYTGRFDEYGSMKDASLAMGPVTINVERIWTRGELPK